MPRPQPQGMRPGMGMGAVPAGMPRMAPPGMARGGVVMRGYDDGGFVDPVMHAPPGYVWDEVNQQYIPANYAMQPEAVAAPSTPPAASQMRMPATQAQPLMPTNSMVRPNILPEARDVSASRALVPVQPQGFGQAFATATQTAQPLQSVRPPRPQRPLTPAYQQAPTPWAPPQPGDVLATGTPLQYPASPNAPRGAPLPSGTAGLPMTPAQVPAPFTRTPQPRPARTPEPRPSRSGSSSGSRKPKARPEKGKTKKREQITNDKATSAFEFARQGQEYLRRKHGKTMRGAIDTPLMPSARSK